MSKNRKKVPSIINSSAAYKIASFIFTQLVFFLVLVFDTLFYRLEVSGRRNLRLQKAFLVSNHSMYLDPATVAQAVYPRRTHFSVLEETFSIPILGGMIRLLGAFPLPKGNPMKVLLGPMQEALDNLGFVHFFPEGKLYPFNTRIKKFKEGVCFFSLHFGIPIVPMTIAVKRKREKQKRNYLFPPKVKMIIGKPLYPEKYIKNNSMRTAMHIMAEDLRRKMQQVLDTRS